MKPVSEDVNRGQLFVAHLDLRWVVFLVEPGVNFKACRGSRCRDQVHHNLERLERNAPPVSGDVAEQAVFDLVPFAGARRIVADLDSEASLVGKSLEFETPQPCSWAVAPAAVSGNQKPRGVRESLLPQGNRIFLTGEKYRSE